ncbi:MAG: hypothetical protein Q7U53_07475 [Anaerolineaceae bacterium]|nr:hypothetical protein [Anaerolineaceae bacterium]
MSTRIRRTCNAVEGEEPSKPSERVYLLEQPGLIPVPSTRTRSEYKNHCLQKIKNWQRCVACGPKGYTWGWGHYTILQAGLIKNLAEVR